MKKELLKKTTRKFPPTNDEIPIWESGRFYRIIIGLIKIIKCFKTSRTIQFKREETKDGARKIEFLYKSDNEK
jgi:hypothetical protein